MGDVDVKYNGRKVGGTILTGATAEVSDVNDLTLLQGRIWTDDEDRRAAHVCVLGYETWQQLFGDGYAVGKQVAIESGLYTVIGVLDKQKQPFGGGQESAR